MKRLEVILFGTTLSILFNLQVAGQRNIKALQIGDTVPRVDLYVVGMATPKIDLGDLRGRAVLLDFWGTFCAPCIASFPKLDSLQKRYGNRLLILPVSDEKADVVQAFFNRMTKVRALQGYSVVEDEALGRLFPHFTVPHYVWINAQGVVCAITYKDDVTAENLDRLVNNATLNVGKKQEIAAFEEPFTKLALEDTTLLECHILTKYTPGYAGILQFGFKNWIKMQNTSMQTLFAFAYGEGTRFFGGFKHIRIITDDSSRFTPDFGSGKFSAQFKQNWLAVHGVSYLLKFPLGDSARKWSLMREDLARFFPFVTATIEKEVKECLVLERVTSISQPFQANGDGPPRVERSPLNLMCSNVRMGEFVALLNLAYQGTDLQVIDQTDYQGNISVDIETEISNPVKLNNELLKYGLRLERRREPTDVLVLKDGTVSSYVGK